MKCKEQISERKSQLGKSTTGDEKLQEPSWDCKQEKSRIAASSYP